jgi:hypothetical protein
VLVAVVLLVVLLVVATISEKVTGRYQGPLD